MPEALSSFDSRDLAGLLAPGYRLPFLPWRHRPAHRQLQVLCIRRDYAGKVIGNMPGIVNSQGRIRVPDPSADPVDSALVEDIRAIHVRCVFTGSHFIGKQGYRGTGGAIAKAAGGRAATSDRRRVADSDGDG